MHGCSTLTDSCKQVWLPNMLTACLPLCQPLTCRAMLWCAMLWCAMLLCAMPCCAVLCCTAPQEWVERYKANRAAAAAELMTLLVKVRGSDTCCVSRGGEGGRGGDPGSEVGKVKSQADTNPLMFDHTSDVAWRGSLARLLQLRSTHRGVGEQRAKVDGRSWLCLSTA